MWNVKTKQIPVTTGATGTIQKSLKKPEQSKARNQGTTTNQPYWTLHTHCGKY